MSVTRKRVCVKCKIEKPLTNHFFQHVRANPKWLSRSCRECWSLNSWRVKNREEYLEKSKKYGEGIREYKRIDSRKRNWDRKLRIIKGYGGKCKCCGENHPEFLTIDHINGGGVKHRKSVGNDFYTFLEVNNFPKKEFRLLCVNCNMSIGLYGYCPHKKKRAA